MIESLSHSVRSTLILCFVLMASVRASADDNSQLSEKHIHFLESHLDAKDEVIRADALGALAAYDAIPQLKRLRAAIHSSSERFQADGVLHIDGHVTPDVLNDIKALIIEKEPKADADGGVSADRLIIESAGLEMLLTSGDANMRTFAVERIRSALEAKEVPLIRWDTLVDLAGRNDLREHVPVIQDTATSDVRKSIALTHLAKLGDADATDRLQKIINSADPKVQVLTALVHDRDAMRAATIDPKELRDAVTKHTFDRPADKDLLLAYLGEPDGVLNRIRTYVRNNGPTNHEEETEIIIVVISVADFGDDRFLRALDDLFDKLPNDSQRIDCSKAILQILARDRTSANRGRK